LKLLFLGASFSVLTIELRFELYESTITHYSSSGCISSYFPILSSRGLGTIALQRNVISSVSILIFIRSVWEERMFISFMHIDFTSREKWENK